MEKIHDMTFCPACGARLNGDESICPFCGYRLNGAGEKFGIETPPPAPETTPPVPPPPDPVTPPPDADQVMVYCPQCGASQDSSEKVCKACGYDPDKTVEDAPSAPPVPPAPVAEEKINVPPPPPPVEKKTAPVTPEPPQKPVAASVPAPPPPKKKSKVWLWLVLILVLLILGAGSIAFLQYNGTLKLSFLSGIIPAKEQPAPVVTASKNYYYCYSIMNKGGKKEIILSNVFDQTDPDNNLSSARNKYNKMVSLRYPNDYFSFGDCMVMKYDNFDTAFKEREKFKKDYEKRKFKIRYIDL